MEIQWIDVECTTFISIHFNVISERRPGTTAETTSTILQTQNEPKEWYSTEWVRNLRAKQFMACLPNYDGTPTHIDSTNVYEIQCRNLFYCARNKFASRRYVVSTRPHSLSRIQPCCCCTTRKKLKSSKAFTLTFAILNEHYRLRVDCIFRLCGERCAIVNFIQSIVSIQRYPWRIPAAMTSTFCYFVVHRHREPMYGVSNVR